ncbi:MAG: hypothetical protein A2836_02475 [Candidatus Taylorbacteria bacterium RIFCSPHIGHO2_01_FULL_45_63]|uniref:10 kDa chaperonin n=1 Tax=Candidatus Taylorbacteria bacterium RIFCSPHIGHO2_02_FULL_45_35 TaxID=1802311 RepID=A0A1G2MU29_9BACT|nr:MAG: hypothetical protein A2836_02475 [Candidatus Taylorbacteria bacterium RIFCSPHIGHO2_01_FULL_45_63]OHA26582.1 MAG: hypothetical protein A3D56_03070 [Candidatus Taylorbacteria bacterium RIFCSPHIGHO2_02_FULL_45_35]OHA33277.1 MAG: hypothetical protein A3A22_01695 [Candidatus Taylorbacteria bacterium RIFCSPLOWO2_01_FULL_45_34b]
MKKQTVTKNVAKTEGVSKVNIEPLADRVLIKLFTKEDKTTGSGIIIPDTVSEDRGSKKGTVVAVGPGKHEEGKLVPVTLKVGQRVLFQRGDVIMIEDEEYHVVLESNVLAIIK